MSFSICPLLSSVRPLPRQVSDTRYNRPATVSRYTGHVSPTSRRISRVRSTTNTNSRNSRSKMDKDGSPVHCSPTTVDRWKNCGTNRAGMGGSYGMSSECSLRCACRALGFRVVLARAALALPYAAEDSRRHDVGEMLGRGPGSTVARRKIPQNHVNGQMWTSVAAEEPCCRHVRGKGFLVTRFSSTLAAKLVCASSE